MDRQTEKRKDIRTYTKTGRRTYGSRTDGWFNARMKETDKQRDSQACSQTYRQTKRQTNKKTDKQVHR